MVEMMGGYSEVEKNIARIWKDILGYEEIDITSNFFEIGGDSISIAKVHVRIDEIYPETV